MYQTAEIEIPQSKEYGWELNEKGELVYKISKKTVLNRIKYIVKACGAILEENTLGCQIRGYSKLSVAQKEQVNREIESAKGVSGDIPEDIAMDGGREVPNFDQD